MTLSHLSWFHLIQKLYFCRIFTLKDENGNDLAGNRCKNTEASGENEVNSLKKF